VDERPAVDLGAAEPRDSRKVLGGAVSLVQRETVSGEFFVELYHQAIPRDFRDDGCCGDAGFPLISADEGAMGVVEPEMITPVDEEVRRLPLCREVGNSLLHGGFCRSENPRGIDACGIGTPDAEEAVSGDPAKRLFAGFRLELLAVANECRDRREIRQNARGCNNRTSERPASSLVNAGDHRCLCGRHECKCT